MGTPRRTTIVRDSVFRRPEAGAATRPQGLISPQGETRQTAVWLADEETEWLDDRCREIRRDGWRAITRSALIRALIRAAMARPPELAGVSGEAELTERLTPPR